MLRLNSFQGPLRFFGLTPLQLAAPLNGLASKAFPQLVQDRLLLTTDTTYLPTGFGPTESTRLLASSSLNIRTIVYTYDDLYRA